MIRNRRYRHITHEPPTLIGFVQRSGSTWLLELLSHFPQFLTVSDPLLSRNSPREDLPLWMITPADARRAYLYLHHALRFSACRAPVIGSHDASRPIVKLANAHWQLHRIASGFGTKPMFLLRHPIDIARSQINHWNMPLTAPRELNRLRHLTAEQYKIASTYLNSGNAFKMRIAEIMIELQPIIDQPEAFDLIHYEALRNREFSGLSGLLSSAQIERLSNVTAKPSRTTQEKNTLELRRPHSGSEQEVFNKIAAQFEPENHFGWCQ